MAKHSDRPGKSLIYQTDPVADNPTRVRDVPTQITALCGTASPTSWVPVATASKTSSPTPAPNCVATRPVTPTLKTPLLPTAEQAVAGAATTLAGRVEWPPYPERGTTCVQIYGNRPNPETGQNYTVTYIRFADRLPDEVHNELPRLLGAHAPTLIGRADEYSVHYRSGHFPAASA